MPTMAMPRLGGIKPGRQSLVSINTKTDAQKHVGFCTAAEEAAPLPDGAYLLCDRDSLTDDSTA